MMGVIDLAIKQVGGSREEWRQVGEAAVHWYATVGEACRFVGPAIIHGGTFRGGWFYGGWFHGGTFHGGVFRGGVFRGGWFHDGVFHDGVFHGGEFRGGEFHDGTFHDGVFRGGEFHGGTFHGGVFRGGVFRGGEFRASPIQLLGACQWPIVVQGRGDGRIAVGCECHTYDEWMRYGERIAEKHNTQWAPVRDALECMRKLIERQQTEQEQC